MAKLASCPVPAGILPDARYSNHGYAELELVLVRYPSFCNHVVRRT